MMPGLSVIHQRCKDLLTTSPYLMRQGCRCPKPDQVMDVCQKLKSRNDSFAFPNASKDDLSWLWFNNSVCSQLNNDLVEKKQMYPETGLSS